MKWTYLLVLFGCGLLEIRQVRASNDIMRKSSSRCENICDMPKTLQKDLLGDCQRGCQYFNIEFLVSATDPKKVVDIKTVEDKCKSSCTEAYLKTARKNACFTGCRQMFELQKHAPYINDWIIYMGASDKGMVLMRSDTDIPSANDWILLESFLEADDTTYDVDHYTLTETKERTDSFFTSKTSFLIDYRLPFWMWLVPTVLLIWILWVICGSAVNGKNIVSGGHIAHEINEKYLYQIPQLQPPKYVGIDEPPCNQNQNIDQTNVEFKT